MTKLAFAILLLTQITLCISCTRAPLRDRAQALRRVGYVPEMSDDLPLESLREGLGAQVKWLRNASADTKFTFGNQVYSRTQYLAGLEYLNAFLEGQSDSASFFSAVKNDFDFFEVYGGRRWSEILLTSYYEAEIAGAPRKTERFTEALLQPPKDLIDVALAKFDDRFQDVGSMRGRMVTEAGRTRMFPYYSREEIGRGALAAQKLELAYADPIDVFAMQIQGSGSILFENGGRLRLGYADQNGHKYQAIGRFLVDQIPLEKITLQTIEAHLRTLSREKISTILNKNPSYIFFRPLTGAATTSLGNGVIPGRTLAVDGRYFPKGALGFLNFQKPQFVGPTSEPHEYVSASRFVFDQDQGGAIKGGGRADLFWGSGEEAKRAAGAVKHAASLYYLAPKDEFLKARGLM